jgi:hypothetical protein
MSKKYWDIGTYRMRDLQGKFTSKKKVKKESFSEKLSRAFFRTVLCAFILGITYTSLLHLTIPNIPEDPSTKISIAEHMHGSVEDLKLSIIQDIKRGENGKPIVIDPPKGKYKCAEDKYSFGKYQFKPCTVIGYYKSLYGKKLTIEQAIMVALDEKKAEQLTYDIVFKAKGINNWHNTAIRLKIHKKLALLADIEN